MQRRADFQAMGRQGTGGCSWVRGSWPPPYDSPTPSIRYSAQPQGPEGNAPKKGYRIVSILPSGVRWIRLPLR